MNASRLGSKGPSAILSRGFTLLELMVVLAIIVLGTALLIPSLASSDNKAFLGEVRQAVSALNYARRIAIARSTPTVATFRFRDPDAPPEDESETEPSLENRIPAWESEDIGIVFRNSRDEDPEESEQVEITFFPQGGSTGGILGFSQGKLSASIQVDPMTGRISANYGEEEP